MPITIDTPIKFLAGVGETRARALEKLGINTVGQLIRHYPRGYQFRGNIKKLAETESGETASFMLIAATDPVVSMLRRGMNVCKLRAFDESASCEITFFNQPYMKDAIKKGCEYRFYGKLTREGGRLLLASPVVEPIVAEKTLPNLVALYPLTAGISQKLLSKLISTALGALLNSPEEIPETLPNDVREKNKLCTLTFALNNIHFPPDFEALAIAKRRLIFEEFYDFVLGAGKSRESESGIAPILSDIDISPFTASLPFELTGAQKRAISEISNDLSHDKPMKRLVSGDVGSGKTAVAAAAAYIAAKNGYQCALMAPTEILAVQHYNDLVSLLDKLGVECRLLTGSTKSSERTKLLCELADNFTGLVIGTHALITEDVKFSSLGLIICDEQHRFGVGQRDALLTKASNQTNAKGHTACHSLLMSATPIPRTLAMFLYGDLDMSVLDELPPGRQKVKTFVVNEDYRERLNGFIRQQHNEGHQTYVVCPSVEEAESGEVTQEDIRLYDYGYDADEILHPHSPPKAAVKWVEVLRESLPDLKFGCVHGKMKSSDKESVMRDFADGKLDVLVSTTVIEVGVNIPNATLMIIENAERFGLSQLHQLRGRVGRGSAKSYCILVSDAKPDSRAYKRLEVMHTTYDGFKIAEFDLSERGPGDFLPQSDGSIRQHGELRFRLANLCEDTELLEAAVSAAKLTSQQLPGKKFLHSGENELE
jgi:ATP-dependent DNA helicase RecG